MQCDLQIIGDRIEFMGYWVGTLNCKGVPTTVRDKFERVIAGTYSYPMYEYNYAAPSKPRKAKK